MANAYTVAAKTARNALFDPLIMQSLFVEEGLRQRAPIVARSSGELWHLFINLGIPLLIIIFLLLILRLRTDIKQNQEQPSYPLKATR